MIRNISENSISVPDHSVFSNKYEFRLIDVIKFEIKSFIGRFFLISLNLKFQINLV